MFISITSKSGQQSTRFVNRSDAQYYRTANTLVSVALKKRSSYPVTYFSMSQDSSSVSFGYGADAQTLSDEFLHCSVTMRGNVKIQRDAMATLPLFYSVVDGQLFLCNNYHELIHAMPRASLSIDALRRALTDGARSIPPHREVHVLYAQQTLHFRDGNISVINNGAFLEDTRHATPVDAQQFAAKYADYLDYFIASRLQGQIVAFEVSGGLDSAVLPQYAARHHNIQPIFSTAFLADDLGYKSQYHKVMTLAQKLDASIYGYRLDHQVNYPLARMVNAGAYHLPYGESTYHEVMQALVSQLRDAGVSVVCTGHGGDEFFGNHVTPGSLLQGMPHSTQIAKLYNNIHIEHGIWPVSPFMDPAMFIWTQGLPVHVRYDRKIMRAFHEAYGFIEEIYNPVISEDFRTFIPNCMEAGKYDTLMQQLTDQSHLQQLQLTDTTDILAKYNRIRHREYTNDEDWIEDAGKLYWWMLTEITARAASTQTSPI